MDLLELVSTQTFALFHPFFIFLFIMMKNQRLGKTSTILACAKQLYTPTEFNAMVLELNASDDRGIGIVRDQIMSFASTKTIFK